MKARIIYSIILCLLLSGCMGASANKKKSEIKSTGSSYVYSDAVEISKFNSARNVASYTAKKLEWIHISTR